MNRLVPWIISAGMHAAAIGAAAYFGATMIVDLELHLQRGRTVVELQASMSAAQADPQPNRAVRIRPTGERPPEPAARAVEIARRDAADPLLRSEPSEISTPQPSTAPPPATRVEMEPDDSAYEPPRPRSIERLPPVAQAAAVPVVASSGSNTTDDTPKLLANPSPPYPADAYAARVEGVVVLDVLVDAQGRVREVTLLESSGSVSLDHAALRAVRDTWRFSVYRPRGVPTAYRREVPVRFQIGPR